MSQDFLGMVFSGTALALAIGFAFALSFNASPDPKLKLMDSLLRMACCTETRYGPRNTA